MSLLDQTVRKIEQTEEIAKKFDVRPDGKVARVATVARGEPEPLRRPVPPAKDYPVDCLGEVLGPAARRIHEVVQAPLALCGQSILAAASLAAQSHADVVIDGRREPLSLWAVSVAESGDRKSAADKLALEAHKGYERDSLEEFAHLEAEYKLELAAHKAAINAASKGKDPDAIKSALANVGPEPERPLDRYLIVGAPTIEGIHRLYKSGQPSIGLFHDDAGEFIGGYTMNKDNRAKSAAGMSRLWDCGEFDRVRGGDGTAKYFGKRLAMHLMIQPVIAETILSDDVLTGQGFLARALLAWPSSKIGTREYVEIDLSMDKSLARYRGRIIDLLKRDQQLLNRNELAPRALTLKPEAKSQWIAVHDAIESDMNAGGDYSSIRAWASKAPAQCLRIAGVLTLIADSDAGVIHIEAINNAATLITFALSEAVRIVGTSAVPVEIRHAEALLSWCHKERKVQLHSRDALQYGPGAVRTNKAFSIAMAELERCGWASPIEGGCEVEGKHRRRVWTILEADQ